MTERNILINRAPVLTLAIHETRCIKERNGDAGDQKEHQKRPVLALANECRLEGCDHKDKL